MAQPLLASQANLCFFECNDLNNMTINLDQFTLISARKSRVGGCWAQIFCASCIRDGNIRLVLENKQTKKRELVLIPYEYNQEIELNLKRIIEAFKTAANQSGETSKT